MTQFGKVLSGDQLLPARMTKDGYQQTVPGFVGGSDAPSSPVIKDTAGTRLFDYRIEHDGCTKISIWRSKNSLDPVNAVNGVVPEGESPDYSNIKWKYMGEMILCEGEEELPQLLLNELSRSRYIKIDVVRGAPIILAHDYGI